MPFDAKGGSLAFSKAISVQPRKLHSHCAILHMYIDGKQDVYCLSGDNGPKPVLRWLKVELKQKLRNVEHEGLKRRWYLAWAQT